MFFNLLDFDFDVVIMRYVICMIDRNNDLEDVGLIFFEEESFLIKNIFFFLQNVNQLYLSDFIEVDEFVEQNFSYLVFIDFMEVNKIVEQNFSFLIYMDLIELKDMVKEENEENEEMKIIREKNLFFR